LGWADPDVVLLDEVAPSASGEQLIHALDSVRSDRREPWTVSIGVSGGRQRCVIASRMPQEALPEFASIVPYPDADRRYLLEKMSGKESAYSAYSMEGGIPVNGAIILAGGRRLLTVIADLQCCGNGPNSWQEYRRRAEVRAIRRLIHRVLKRTSVDGILVAGDFNLVNGPTPLVMLSEPYSPGDGGLIAAELHHPDGITSWTWDGRGTPFPSGKLDYQLYDPQSLVMRSGFILDTERLSLEVLERHGLRNGASGMTGRHRPLLVEYGWN
ncbi:MAG: endonuclease/exonuclease/phosphatase family protein, partial [Rhodothermales bacterium]|nr:endonuclease/exonuclease/phosphatase family protein [Rhodothermales bacterium]